MKNIDEEESFAFSSSSGGRIKKWKKPLAQESSSGDNLS
jgi:hypothetical protein